MMMTSYPSRFIMIAAAAMLLTFSTGTTRAQTATAKILSENCGPELASVCKTVKPGQARAIACLYSHAEKISKVCYLSLFSVSRQLENAMVGFRKAKFECQSSIDSLCGKVPTGGGRVLNCLLKNKHRIPVPECAKLVNALK